MKFPRGFNFFYVENSSTFRDGSRNIRNFAVQSGEIAMPTTDTTGLTMEFARRAAMTTGLMANGRRPRVINQIYV